MHLPSLALLHRAGWIVGDYATVGPGGLRKWHVVGSKGAERIRVESSTRRSAWLGAVAKADLPGTLGRSWGLT